mmetsp:Transcript_6535/g.13527  ORF Transcript_6535/g.13527 Transcript_6535/m.13527 type:complete len:256 (-) Transcript_6535:432-1199(-)
MGVDDVGNAFIVHMTSLAANLLSNGYAFLLGLVRQHRPADHIANRVDPGHVGCKVVIDLNLPSLVDLDANVVKAQAICKGDAASRAEDDICIDHLLRTTLNRLDGEGGAALRLSDGRHDLRTHLELHPLLLKDPLQRRGDLRVHAWCDAIEELDYSHLGAEAPPHRAHLETDDASANNDHLLWDGSEIERASRGDNHLLIDRHAWQLRWLRARSNDDVLSGEGGCLRAVDGCALDGAGREDFSRALEVVDLVLLK